MSTFTPRQQEVAKLVHMGLQYKSIATMLGISHKTVKIHATMAAAKVPGKGSHKVKLTRFYERHYAEDQAA